MNKIISIDGRKIGEGLSPYIVAELSANHNGKLQRALDSISAAKQAGADAVKIQTYTADTITIDCSLPDFQITEGPWKGYRLYDLYKQAETPYEWHAPIFSHAKKVGITCFSTPFDETAVDLLEGLGAPAYKVASFEAIDLPLIKYIASTKKPMIISTGMANLEEIEEAVQAARDGGCSELVLLHCISSYPAPVEQSNILTVPDLKKRFGVEVGLSDHSMGNVSAMTAVALGACFVEKHFMLDKNEDGPDSAFSITPGELEILCRDLRQAWRSLGAAGYDRKEGEVQNVKFRRSLYFVKDMKKGELITKECIRRIRPGFGLAPKHEDRVLNKTLNENVTRGMPVRDGLFRRDKK